MSRLPGLSPLPDLRHERALARRGCVLVVGLDEVGRGAWAGPVVAAAVGLPLESRQLRRQLSGVRDSKQMSPRERQACEPRIRQAAWGCTIGVASVEEIDALGILVATRLAMLRATTMVVPSPDGLLIDYLTLPELAQPQLALKFGDQRSLSIAAASVVAKVHRDRLMVELDRIHPGYGLGDNKGYGTAAHRSGLDRQGPSAIHRRSFAPVARLLEAKHPLQPSFAPAPGIR
jgi:ribonuclease HII